MNLRPFFRHLARSAAVAFVSATFLFALSAGANVYATNLRLNDGATNVLAAPGDSVTIGYILNEPASLGVTLKILNGKAAVRTINLPADGPGALRGLNTVTWDGKTDAGMNAAPGIYSVSITAAASGYSAWTHLTSDSDPGTYVWEGRGISVDRDAASPYYGRVLIANADFGLDLGKPGDVLGILKLNADATPADEGEASGGQDGYNWTGQTVSPWKLGVSADDYVYVDDLARGGEVWRWDPTISSNSIFPVLRADNRRTGARLSGPAILGTGTNTQIWMADTNSTFGIIRWTVAANGACATNDTGVTVVGLGGDLALSPYAVAVDNSGNIYTCQFVATNNSPLPRVFRFPAYNPATNGGLAETTAAWAAGTNDDASCRASGLAVDPTGTYLAVAFQGLASDTGVPLNGGTRIFETRTGQLVTNLDLNLNIGGDTAHQDTDCAWDAAGNVYYIDWWLQHWRAVSPPGPNQATTTAPELIQIIGSGVQAPFITRIDAATGTVTVQFTGAATDPPSAFTLLSAAEAAGTYAPDTGATISQVSPGLFQASVPKNGARRFYRIQR